MSEETAEPMQARPSALERHAQTALSAVVVALVLWIGQAVSQQGQTIVRLETQVTSLQQVISSDNRNRYSADRAHAELALRDNRLGQLERRLDAAEAEIRSFRDERRERP